jgi:hypothetical protein
MAAVRYLKIKVNIMKDLVVFKTSNIDIENIGISENGR